MFASSSTHHLSFARSEQRFSEQSIRRSFASIHRSICDTSMLLSPLNTYSSCDTNIACDIATNQEGQLNIDHHGKASQRNSISDQQGRQRKSSGVPNHTRTRRATPPLSSEDIPILSVLETLQPKQRKFSNKCLSKKFQQQRSPGRADTVHEITETKLVNEEQRARQRSTEVRPAGSNVNPGRQYSVSFAPITTPPSLASIQTNNKQNKGFRNDYSIGETLRSSSHMIEDSSEQTFQAVSSLKNHDFAFIKRSNGSYSFAILAYRSMEPIKGDKTKSSKECMVFVISDNGATKMVREKDWSETVRLVSVEGLQDHTVANAKKSCATPEHRCRLVDQYNIKDRFMSRPFYQEKETTPPVLCQEIEPENIRDWVPPSTITFIPQTDEECSLISSVSDRATLANSTTGKTRHK
mmetsp:Transcript_23506/g.42460  ORF Transcript_23506/g.42460 Transcript_23506/m.42460 type:complete len:410 (+) Transcript_23506:104-1333(+)